MRVLAFSDWRVQSMESLFEIFERLESPVDLILYAGDDVARFRDGNRNIFSEIAKETHLGMVLAVRGNDDVPFTGGALEGVGVHDLHQSPFVYDNYVFIGLEGAIEGGPGYILHSENEIERHLKEQYAEIKGKIPVLLSHVPPRGILDIALRFGQRHIGSASVRSFIEETEPVVTVCGHCHQFGGRAEQGDFGTVINISSHDSPGAKGNYSIIELAGREIEYKLTTTENGVEHKLLQLSQVGGRRIRHFLDADITELDQINDENRNALESLPGSSKWHVDMWIKEAGAIRNNEIRVLDENEFEFLKDDNIVLVDIETDLSQERIWLIGLYSFKNDELHQIFEKDDEEELLKLFIEYLRIQENPSVVYYGNNLFDEKCLIQRMEAHGLLYGHGLMKNSYDLGIKVQTNLLGEFNRINLDTLAGKIADYEYKYPEMDGFIVGSQYTHYLLDNEEPDWDKLLNYNQDDVLALKSVVDRIRRIISS